MMNDVMKKISFVFLVLLVCSCSDGWKLSQQAKTLSGSVSSIEPFLYEGSIDGISIIPTIKCPQFLHLNRETDNSITISVEINPEAQLSDIVSFSAPSIKLSGQTGDVSFDQAVKLSVSSGSRMTVDGRISGWLQRQPLTKTSPEQPNLTGSIAVTWTSSDTIGEEHRFVINKIICQTDWSDYFASQRD